MVYCNTNRKGKPIGGGHSLENCSELTARVGSTPTPSAKNFGVSFMSDVRFTQLLLVCLHIVTIAAIGVVWVIPFANSEDGLLPQILLRIISSTALFVGYLFVLRDLTRKKK